jgi:hypothetical protein
MHEHFHHTGRFRAILHVRITGAGYFLAILLDGGAGRISILLNECDSESWVSDESQIVSLNQKEFGRARRQAKRRRDTGPWRLSLRGNMRNKANFMGFQAGNRDRPSKTEPICGDG